MSKIWISLSLAIVILQACLIGILPYFFNGFILTTPDDGGWACGAQALADTGTFSIERTAGLGYNFNICWGPETYPGVQYILAGIVKVTHIAAYQLVPFVLIGLLTLTAVTVWGIGYKMSRSLTVATIAGVATSITPIVLRAQMLTPQNLFGYWLISVLVLLLLQIIYTKQRWWWLAVIVVAGALGYVHSLSFGVAGLACAAWFYGWYLPSWRWRITIAGVGLVFTGLVWWLDFLPVSIHVALNLFQSGAFSGYDHPLYDHPAFLGYGLSALAAIGLLFGEWSDRRAYWLMVCWLVMPLIMGHLAWFDIILMPDRFIAYLWLSVVIFAAVGLTKLRVLLGQRTVWLSLVLLLWGAQLAHAVIYIKDDVAGWSARFKPHAEFIEALQWLNTQSDRGILVGIMAAANREITFAPLWYDGPVASYPWYNLNHKDIKSFKANSNLYKQIFQDPTSAEYLRVQAFYTMIAKPKSAEAYPAALRYNLAYLILPKTSQADLIWQKAQPSYFAQIYENEKYRIFRLR